MKNILGLSLGLSLSLMAMSTFAKVQDLSNGSCWAKVDGHGLKLSSFTNARTWDLSHEDLIDLSIRNLPYENKSAPHSVATFCGAYGAFIVAKGKNYCLWLSPTQGSDEWHVSSYGALSPEDKTGSACDGVAPGELTFFLDSGNIENFKSWVESEAVGIKSWVKLGSKSAKVVLDKDYEFREKDWIKEFAKEAPAYIKHVELNHFFHPNGEWYEVGQY